MENNVCNQCGKEFASYQGVRQHQKLVSSCEFEVERKSTEEFSREQLINLYNRSVKLFEDGWSSDRIADMLGLYRSTVANWVKERNKPKLPPSDEEKEKICKLYKEGKSQCFLYEKFNRSFKTIRKILEDNGIEIRSKEEAARLRNCDPEWYRNHDKSLIEKVVEMYKSGQSIVSIASELGKAESTISSWLDKEGVEKRTPSEVEKLLYKRGEKEPTRPKKEVPKKPDKLTPDFAYLLGVLGPGDGYVFVDKEKRDYRIGLDSTDYEFNEKFAHCVESCYGLPLNTKSAEGEEKKGQFKTKTNSIEVVKDILRWGELEEFRHYNERVPEKIKESSRNIKSSYLRAFFDSQGCVTPCAVVAVKANEELMKEISELLQDLGIKNKVLPRPKESQRDQYVIQITARKNLEAFSEKVNFTIKRKKKKLEKKLDSYEEWQKTTKEVDSLVPKMIELFEEGLSFRKIADECGICTRTVHRRLTPIIDTAVTCDNCGKRLKDEQGLKIHKRLTECGG